MKTIYTIIGVLCVALGTLGIFLPVLPTTPFLLSAAYLFYKSDPRLRDWLINHPVLGFYIKNYLEHHAIPLHAKIATISTLWITIGFSAYIVEKTWVRLLLLLIAVGVTIHLLLFKTLKVDNKDKKEDQIKTNQTNNKLTNN